MASTTIRATLEVAGWYPAQPATIEAAVRTATGFSDVRAVLDGFHVTGSYGLSLLAVDWTEDVLAEFVDGVGQDLEVPTSSVQVFGAYPMGNGSQPPYLGVSFNVEDFGPSDGQRAAAAAERATLFLYTCPDHRPLCHVPGESGVEKRLPTLLWPDNDYMPQFLAVLSLQVGVPDGVAPHDVLEAVWQSCQYPEAGGSLPPLTTALQALGVGATPLMHDKPMVNGATPPQHAADTGKVVAISLIAIFSALLICGCVLLLRSKRNQLHSERCRRKKAARLTRIEEESVVAL